MPENSLSKPGFTTKEIDTPSFTIVQKLYNDRIDYIYEVTDKTSGVTFQAFGNGNYWSPLKPWGDRSQVTSEMFRNFIIEFTLGKSDNSWVIFTDNGLDLFSCKSLKGLNIISYDKEGNIVPTPDYHIAQEGFVADDRVSRSEG